MYLFFRLCQRPVSWPVSLVCTFQRCPGARPRSRCRPGLLSLLFTRFNQPIQIHIHVHVHEMFCALWAGWYFGWLWVAGCFLPLASLPCKCCSFRFRDIMFIFSRTFSGNKVRRPQPALAPAVSAEGECR